MKLSLLAMGFILGSPLAVATTVFYDVDFGEPVHFAGSEPQVLVGSEGPSEIRFGSPKVEESYGALTNQPLVFNTAGNPPSFYYDQISFSLGSALSSNTYHLSFDYYANNLIGSNNVFTVLFDSPAVSSLNINGTIEDPPRTNLIVEDGQLRRIDISVNVDENRRVILVDGQQVFDGQLLDPPRFPSGVRRIRFSHGLELETSPPDHSSFVAIDNIRITDGFLVPEVSTSLLSMLGVAVFGLRRRRSPLEFPASIQ